MEHVKALCTDWECSVCKQAPSAPEAMSVVAEQNAAILLQELSKALARVKELEGKAGFVDFKAAYQMMQKERDAVLAELARMRDALRQSESAIRSVKHKVWTTEMHRAMLAIAQALAESQFCHSETGPLKNTELGSPGEKGREG